MEHPTPSDLVAAVVEEITEQPEPEPTSEVAHTVLELHRKPGLVYVISEAGLQVIGPDGDFGHTLVYFGHIAIMAGGTNAEAHPTSDSCGN